MAKILSLIFALVFGLSFDSHALTVNSLTSDMNNTSSTTNALIGFAGNYDSFYGSDYVCFCTNDNEYYIAWGKDFYVEGTYIKCDSSVEVILYYRNSSYQYNRVYTTSDNLSVNVNRIVTSSTELGQRSATADTFYSVYWDEYFNISIIALIVIIVLFRCRSGYSWN